LKALSPMIVSSGGSETEVRAVHERKASASMVWSCAGSEMEVIAEQE